MFEEKRSILEPAGALAIAGAQAFCKYYGLKGENVVAVTSGANMNFDKLRLVSQLADVGKQHEPEAVPSTFVLEKWEKFIQFNGLVCQKNTSYLCPISHFCSNLFVSLDFLNLSSSFALDDN